MRLRCSFRVEPVSCLASFPMITCTSTRVDYKAPVGPLASTRDCTKMSVRCFGSGGCFGSVSRNSEKIADETDDVLLASTLAIMIAGIATHRSFSVRSTLDVRACRFRNPTKSQRRSWLFELPALKGEHQATYLWVKDSSPRLTRVKNNGNGEHDSCRPKGNL